jgi:hypothetical protein
MILHPRTSWFGCQRLTPDRRIEPKKSLGPLRLTTVKPPDLTNTVCNTGSMPPNRINRISPGHCARATLRSAPLWPVAQPDGTNSRPNRPTNPDDGRRRVGEAPPRRAVGDGGGSTTPRRGWCSWSAPERRFRRRRQAESRPHRPRRSRSRPGRPSRGRRKISPWRERFLSWYHLVMQKRASVVSPTNPGQSAQRASARRTH